MQPLSEIPHVNYAIVGFAMFGSTL
jgi:hypothetical protein